MTARHNVLRRPTVKMLTICGVTCIVYAAAAALAADVLKNQVIPDFAPKQGGDQSRRPSHQDSN